MAEVKAARMIARVVQVVLVEASYLSRPVSVAGWAAVALHESLNRAIIRAAAVPYGLTVGLLSWHHKQPISDTKVRSQIFLRLLAILQN